MSKLIGDRIVRSWCQFSAFTAPHEFVRWHVSMASTLVSWQHAQRTRPADISGTAQVDLLCPWFVRTIGGYGLYIMGASQLHLVRWLDAVTKRVTLGWSLVDSHAGGHYQHCHVQLNWMESSSNSPPCCLP